MFAYVNLFVAMLVVSLVAMSETRTENECTRRFDRATTVSSDPGHCCTKYFECKCMHALCVKAANNDSAQCAQFNDDCYDFMSFAPKGCSSVTWDNFADKCTNMNKELDLMFHSKIGENYEVDKSAAAGGSSIMTTVIWIVIVAFIISLAGFSIWLARRGPGHRGTGKKGSGHASSRHKHHKTTIRVDQGKSNRTVASTAKQSCKQQVDGEGGGKDRHMAAESHGHSASKVTHKHTNHQISPKVTNHAQEDQGSFDSRAVNTRILPGNQDKQNNNLPSQTQLKNMLR